MAEVVICYILTTEALFDLEAVCVQFVVDRVGLGQNFMRELWFSPCDLSFESFPFSFLYHPSLLQ
jgi:hypothetical protein